MLRKGKPDQVGVSITYPLPGTKLHQLVSTQLGQKKHWADSGDLTMMFRGTYSTEFYRAITDAIHLEVRHPESAGDIKNAWAQVDAMKAASLCEEAVLP